MVFIKRIINKILTQIALKKGYSSYFAPQIPRFIIKDFRQNNNSTFNEKLWAYKRGFLSSRANTYQINESNYRNHMPDFDYYKLHPLNGRYGNWIDDKLTMKYILSPFNEYLPKYYFQLEDNEILRLMDCPEGIESDINGILKLLEQEKDLAVKLYSGSLGEGFYKLSHYKNSYYINTKVSNLTEVTTLLSSLKGYLITEYIISHELIRKIYDITPNTLRLQLIRNENQKPKVVGSLIRFGTKNSGILETPLAGGIRAAVDINNGRIFDSHIITNKKVHKLVNHPDTNESLEITLPHWDEIVSKVQDILSYLPQLTYVGFDIVITDQGFKILEINSLTSINGISYYYPYFADEYSREYFINKFNKRPDKFKRVLEQLKEMETKA